MSVTQVCGPMGAGKTFSVVDTVLLPNLKKGRTVVTNITGLDHEAIAAYLKMDAETIRKNLLVHGDEDINDEFWPDEQGGGKVPHGSICIIDEAWKFVRDKGHLTPRLMDYIRRHRKWAAGDPPVSCEIVFVTQSKTDLHRAIVSVTDQIFQVRKNLFSGFMSFYSVTLFQPGQRKPLSHTNKKYDKRIFKLYKSHSVDNVVEQAASGKGSLWADRQTWVMVGAAVLAVAGSAYMLPKLLNGSIVPVPKGAHAATLQNGLPAVPQPPSGHATSGAVPSSTATAAPPPIQPAAIASLPAVAGVASAPAVFSRVLQLRGDPEAVQRVSDAFCGKAGDCQGVVNAATQQIVLVGSEGSVNRLEKLIGSLAVRPPSQLVKVILFEADNVAQDDLNLYAGISGSSSLVVGSTKAQGVTGALSIGSFSIAFNKLVGSGSVRLLSAPEVQIWPGQTAVIKSGLSVPILGSIVVDQAGRQTQVLDYRDSGLIMSLTQVSSGERPVVKLDIESSSYGDVQVGVANQPTKTQRILSSMVELPSCQVVVIGGLDQYYQNQQNQKFFGFTTNRGSQEKTTRVFVALVSDGVASGHTCPADTGTDSASKS